MHPDRLEIELFGTERNGDGRESVSKVGFLEQAHSGTLLLDEVADMPLETQGKIVRVLQEQTFERVGGKTKVDVDVRVIAATSRDLQAEMSNGRFRQDLFYRLNVVPMRVPALRERRDDIPELLDHFMRVASEQTGLPARTFGDDTLALLQAYDWPGNVRQLRNIIERTIILAPQDRVSCIEVDLLPSEVLDSQGAVGMSNATMAIMGSPLREARESFEREYLKIQIRRFSGNISRTASFIGMERSALHRKLKALGIADKRDAEE
jgi:two-component system nitrogen regulation response regulator NtrX